MKATTPSPKPGADTAAETRADDRFETPTERAAFDAGKTAAGNRALLYAMGGVAILGGIAAIAMPFVASIAAALTTGWVLVICGCVGLFAAFRRDRGWQLAAGFALSLVTIVAGILFVLQPMAGILALTTLIIAYFAATGALRLYYGARSLSDGGGWMVALGALTLVLAILLWFGLPFNAAWLPGLLLGIDLILWGALLVALAARAGRTPPEQATNAASSPA